MTTLDVLGLMLTVMATIGMLTWCLELEQRATESPRRDDDRTPIYLLGCEYWIALEVAPTLAGHRPEDVAPRSLSTLPEGRRGQAAPSPSPGGLGGVEPPMCRGGAA